MSDFGQCERRLTVTEQCGKPAVGIHKLCEECRQETKTAVIANLRGLRREVEAQREVLRSLL